MSEENFTQEKKATSSINKGLLVLNIVLLISIGILYILFFTNNNNSGKTAGNSNSGTTTDNAELSYGDIKIAYVNTDSIMVHYKLAAELEKEIVSFRNNLENSYTGKVQKLQTDFQEYLKVGATLTLTEQKNREESFKRREQEIGELQERMIGQIQEKQISENIRLLNAVFAFIRDYNQKNQQFNIILKKSFADSPVMYIDENMDITQEIIDGLNKEYDELQKK